MHCSDDTVVSGARALEKKLKHLYSTDPRDKDPATHIEYLRDVLEKESTSTATKLTAIKELSQMKVTVDLVISSKIGHVISTLRKSSDSSIAAAAKQLRTKWKRDFSEN